MTSPPGRSPWGIAPASDSGRQESSASLPSLSSGVELLIDGGTADAGQGIVGTLHLPALITVGGTDVVERPAPRWLSRAPRQERRGQSIEIAVGAGKIKKN